MAVVALCVSLLSLVAPWAAVHAVASSPPDASPSPSPSPEPALDPTLSTSPEPTPAPSPSLSPEPSPSPDPSPAPSPSTVPPTPPESPRIHGVRVLPWFGPIWGPRAAPDGDAIGEGEPLEGGSPNHGRTPDLTTEQLLGGTYSAERLVVAAAMLRAAGWSEERIRRDVYAPFIVVGPASWGDSWHAPRYGPGPIVREHEGQDVLCRYGAEVLAPEDGTIEFATSRLGGRSARLVRPNGSSYYFAHFVDWNDRRFSDGDQVRRGDVIGYCGDTGNASVAHVHVGWYGPDGDAIDPMRRLISWLEDAEGDLPASISDEAAAAAEALGSAGPGPDIGWALLHDPLSSVDLAAWRTSTESHDPLDLTPVVMFLVVLGATARRSGSRRSRIPLPGGSALSARLWAGRRGPLLS